MFRYEVISAFYHSMDGAKYVGYGLRAVCDGVPVVQIEDITDNEEELLLLAEECSRLQLEPVHLPDVVEDFLLNR